MNELESGVQLSCCVTTFFTPDTFWLIFDQDICARDDYCSSLNYNQEQNQYTRLTKASEGELVIFNYNDYWVRGQIADIVTDISFHKEYLCWLLDYGIFVSTSTVYKLDGKDCAIPPFVRKAILYGILSIKKADNFGGVTQAQDEIQKVWAPGIVKCSNQLIKQPNTFHRFCVKMISDDFVIGDLFLNNAEGCLNIGEKLVSTGLATYHENFFRDNLDNIKNRRESLSYIYRQTKFFSEQDKLLIQTQVRFHGRGAFRCLQKFPNRMENDNAGCKKLIPTDKKEISSSKIVDYEIFEDADDKIQSTILCEESNLSTSSVKSLGHNLKNDCKRLSSNDNKTDNDIEKTKSVISDVGKCFPAGSSIKFDKPATEIVKNFENNLKQDVIDKKNAKIAGLCLCENCIGWRSNDSVFSPVNIKVLKKPEKPKFVLKPPLLFKSDSEDKKYEVITKREFRSDTEKLAAPRILVHSVLQAGSTSDLPHTPFDEKIQSALRKLNYSNANSIQTYTWPAILRGLNVIIVSVADCGKTMTYVPALCNSTFHKNPDLPNVVGPTSIILCPGVEVVETLFKLFQAIISNAETDTKVVAYSYWYTKQEMGELSRGVDILITTPRLLIKLLKETKISLTRVCHIVLEESHELFSLFPREVDYILNKIQTVLENRQDCIQVQLIVISQEWTKRIEDLAKKLEIPPLISIGAHLEAALYGKADIRVTLSTLKDKPSKTVQKIKDTYKFCKTIIICIDDETPNELLTHLETHGIYYEILSAESTIEEINTTKQRWFATPKGTYFVLICSDHIFNTGLAITDAEIIVQYSLPETWSQFTFRFSGFLDSYSSPIISKMGVMKKCQMHILVDETNTKQFPRIIQFLKRMGTELTQSLLSFYEKLISDIENNKLENKINICESLLAIGSCKNTITCKYRHIFNQEVDINPLIPQSGLIKCKILTIISPVHFFVRIFEHTDSEGVEHNLNDSYGLLVTEMLSLNYKDERLPFKEIKIGNICAVLKLEGSAGAGTYQRAKILEIFRHNFKITKVSVYYIDLGSEQTVIPSQLYTLPESVKKIPCQCVPLHICNIGPTDFDTTWPRRCFTLIKNVLKKNEHNKASCYFSGRIKLQLGEGLFVEDLQLYEILEDNFVLKKLSIRESLMEFKGGEKRPNHLKILYQYCQDYKIPLKDYNLPALQSLVKVQKQAKPYWAYFESEKEYHPVYFGTGRPDEFFIQLTKFIDCLENLQKDIKSAMTKPFYRKVVLPVEGQCYLVYNEVRKTYSRAILNKINNNIAYCFFVDYGGNTEIPIDELRFLPDDLITKLPFQAIECKLYGIKSSNRFRKWSQDATDLLVDKSFQPGTNKPRNLHVKIMKHEKPKYTNNEKHCVILIDLPEEIIINNLLLDTGFAIPVKDIKIEIDFETLKAELNKNNSETQEEEIVEENEEINYEDEGDDEWDFQINDPEAFFRALIKGPEQYTKPAIAPEVRSNFPELKSRPAQTVDYSTPNIVWQQTNSHVILKIQIPSVTTYETKILHGRILTFNTLCRGTKYKVHLTLFTKVQSKFEHSNVGLYVMIKLKKLKEEDWPRLTLNNEKLRYITYNFENISVEDDSDDDKPLPQKMIQNSKNLGKELSKEAENGSFIYEYGSDIDWEESDFESSDEEDY